MHEPKSAEWLAAVTEDIIDPARPIIDSPPLSSAWLQSQLPRFEAHIESDG